MSEHGYAGGLRMRQLPKPEYYLMRDLIEKYSLRDPCELFTVALRLVHEVLRYDQGRGEQWFINVINTYRSYPHEQREYSLPD